MSKKDKKKKRAEGEEGLTDAEACNIGNGTIRLVVSGTGGPSSANMFMGAGFNPDPDGGVSTQIPNQCFVGPGGAGAYDVVFEIPDDLMNPGDDYTVQVVFMGAGSPHFYSDTWETEIGECEGDDPCDS